MGSIFYMLFPRSIEPSAATTPVATELQETFS